MRLIVYGESNQNLQIILPYLKEDKLDLLPEDIVELGIQEQIFTRRKGKIIPGKKFVLFTEEMNGLKEDSLKYYHILSESLPRLIRLFNSSHIAKQGYEWDELQHMILFAFCLDLGILEHLYKQGVLPKRTSGYYLWGFKSEIKGRNPFGIKLWSSKTNELGVGELWHPQITPSKFGLNEADLDSLYKIYQGLNGQSDLKQIILFKYSGLIVEEKSSAYKIAIPIFDWRDRDEFLDYLHRVTLRIIEEVTLPVLERYHDRSIYKHGVVRLLMEYAADLVVERELVSSFAGVKHVYQKNWLFTNLFHENSFIHYLKSSG